MFSFKAGRSEQHRGVANGVGVFLAIRIFALEEFRVLSRLLGYRDHHLVGCHNRAALSSGPPSDKPRISRVVAVHRPVDGLDVCHRCCEEEEHCKECIGGTSESDVHTRSSSDTRSSNARITKLASRDDPPYDMNGRVRPVIGMTLSTPERMMIA